MNNENNYELLCAYKKWKVYVYEDLHAHYLRIRIAEFEAKYKFDENKINNALLEFYNNIQKPEFIKDELEKIKLLKLPKLNKHNNEDKNIISNVNLHGEKVDYLFNEVNVLIDVPVEFHVISTLFVLKSIKYLDINYKSAYAFRPTFNMDMWSKDSYDSYDFNVNFFEKYYIGYNSWLNNALTAIESHTKLGDNIILMSLDFKRFYYNINFDFNKLDEFLQRTEFNKSERALLNIIKSINEKYNVLYKELYQHEFVEHIDKPKENALPLGMIYSPILANWYLHDLDKEIKNSITPIYYGRYLDDLLIAVNYKLDEKKDKNEILKDIFCEKVFNITDNRITWTINGIEHEINTDKYKLFNFNSKGSNALIEVYSKEIKRNSSAFKFLPQDKEISKNFQNSVYHLQFNCESKNIYDIEMFGGNKFSFSTYLSSAIKLVSNRDNKTKYFEGFYTEISKYFFTHDILEYFELWEKLFTLFVLVGDQEGVVNLFNRIYTKLKNIKDKYLFNGLEIHLLSSVSMALALNDNIRFNNQDIYIIENLKKIYRLSYMVRALYVNNSALMFTDFYKENLMKPKNKFDLTQDLYKMLVIFYKEDKHIFKKINKYNNGRMIPFKKRDYYIDLLKLYENIILNNDNYEDNSNSKYGIENYTTIKVGVVNFETRNPFSTLEINMKGEKSKDIENEIIELINLAVNKGCNLLVFPELAIPIQMYNKILDLCVKNHMAIIGGLEYIENNNFVYNFLLKVFPYKDVDNRWKVKVIFDLKKYYAPLEAETIIGLGLKIPKWEQDDRNKIVEWNNVRIGSLNCYEAANIELRSKFKSNVDLLTISEHNQDLEYYQNLCKSTYRDIHCYLVQANVSKYGDSQIIQPAKNNWERELVKIKGDHNNSVFIQELDIDGLRRFQAKEFGLQNKPNETFKPTPPGFDKNKIRSLLYNK